MSKKSDRLIIPPGANVAPPGKELPSGIVVPEGTVAPDEDVPIEMQAKAMRVFMNKIGQQAVHRYVKTQRERAKNKTRRASRKANRK